MISPVKDILEINSSAVLKGNMSKGNIYVNPTADTIIVLDNFSMDEKTMLIVRPEQLLLMMGIR